MTGTTSSPPTVTIIPASACAGVSFNITGTNFTGATAVKIGTTAADAYTVNSATSISATFNSAVAAGTVSVTNAAGTGNSLATLAVITTPTGVNATPSANPVCNNTSFTLTGAATGATSYSWAGQGGYTSTSQSPTFNITTTNAGVFTFTATNVCGSTTATSSSISVTTVPTSVSATPSANPACNNASFKLTGAASGATSYNWAGQGGYTSTSQSPTFNITTTNAGVFTFTATNVCGSTTATTGSVLVTSAAPSGVSATPSANPACNNTSFTLTGAATGATSYSWAGQGGYTSTSQSPTFNITTTNAGVFTFTATNVCGSTTATSSSISVTTVPTSVSATPSANPACNNASFKLTGAASGATSYNWAGQGGYTSTSQSPTFNITTTNAGVFTFTATNVCGSTTATTGSVLVTSAAPSGVSATPSANPACNNTSFTLTGAATGATSYSWAGQGGYTSTSQSPTFNITTTNAGVFTFTATNGCGSTTATTSSVSVTSAAPSSVSATPSANPACNNTSFTLTGAATGATSYSWAGQGGYTSTSQSPTFNITTTNAGVFTFTATNVCGSTTATTASVTVNTLPADPTGSISVTANPACGSTTLSYPAGTGGVNYYWQTASNGVSTSLVTNGTANNTVTTSGTYYVRAFNNCWSTNSLASAAITINTAPVITASPSNVTVNVNNPAVFSVTATNAASYQWFESHDGGATYGSALATGGVYIVTGNSLTVTPTSTSYSGYTYKAVAKGTSPCSDATSTPSTGAILTVNSTPIALATWNPTTTNTPTTASNVTGSIIGPTSGTDYGTSVTNVSSPNPNYGLSGSHFTTSGTNNANEYFQFSLSPATGYHMDITSLALKSFISSSSSLADNVVIYYSTSASFTSPTLVTSSSVLSVGTSSSINTLTSTNATLPSTISGGTTLYFRIYMYNTNYLADYFNLLSYGVNGYITADCATADALVFVQQPTTVTQGTPAMSPAVTVKAICSASGYTAGGYAGNVTLKATSGCGYISQTVQASAGIATFSNIVFTRSPQSNVQFTASASGLTSATSNTFSITAPGGNATTATIAAQDFESGSFTSGTGPTTFTASGTGNNKWSFTTSTPVYSSSGGTSGGDRVTIANFSGNHVLDKTYLADNVSGTTESTNTITFSNQTGLSSYNSLVFNFQIASVGTGSGAGIDNGEYMEVDISLDGGTSWSPTLVVYGHGDYLFPLSSSPVASVAYNANAQYNDDQSNANTQSAFSVTLPGGTSQFMFRFVAQDNRTEENLVIDNISLLGITNGSTTPSPLPTAKGSTTNTCPSVGNTISVVLTNASSTNGAITYAWSPSTNITNTSVSNPTVSPTVSTIYTVTVTDGDGCTVTGKDTITLPSGAVGTWTGAKSIDWFVCQNWGMGVIPTTTTNVTIGGVVPFQPTIDPTSAFAAAYSGIAYGQNVTVDANTVTILPGSGKLSVSGNLTIQNSGKVDMTSGGLLEVTGSLTGTGGTFTGGTGTVSFLNGGTSTITLGSGAFNTLNINKTAGSKITLGSSITATLLNVNTGIFEIPANKIATSSIIKNFASGNINVLSSGKLKTP